jgi:hypothetical protein
VLLDPAYYVTSIKTVRTPFYLELLREIAYKHPFQVPRFATTATPGHLLTPPPLIPTIHCPHSSEGPCCKCCRNASRSTTIWTPSLPYATLPSPIPSRNRIRNTHFLFVGIVPLPKPTGGAAEGAAREHALPDAMRAHHAGARVRPWLAQDRRPGPPPTLCRAGAIESPFLSLSHTQTSSAEEGRLSSPDPIGGRC